MHLRLVRKIIRQKISCEKKPIDLIHSLHQLLKLDSMVHSSFNGWYKLCSGYHWNRSSAQDKMEGTATR